MKWLLLAKHYTTPLLWVLLVVGLGGVWIHGYVKGKTVERTVQELRHATALEAARMAQERLADELEREKQKRKIVYRDRVQVVDREFDPSGCADLALPPGVLDALGGVRDGQ